MQRLFLFLLLVVVLPLGIYWASHGFESPGANLERFSRELGDLRRPAPPPPKPTPAPEAPPNQPPPTPETEPPAPPVELPASPEEVALRHFRAGEFEAAGRAYAGRNEEQRALAQMGAALATAFPENLPSRPYVVAKSESGSEFEGFAEEDGANVRLVDPGGRSLALPAASLHSRVTLSRQKAVERMAGQITEEASRGTPNGVRLFAMLQRAFAIGRPDVAAPLLARAMAADDEERYFLTSVRSRAPEAHHGPLYRAYSACQLSKAPPVETVSNRTPLRIGEPNGGPPEGKQGDERPNRDRTTVKSAQAREIMVEASPLRSEGEKLYRKIAIQELREAKVSEIDEAIRLLDKAATLYEKAMAIEDNNEIFALLRHSSRLLFSLRFWKQQVEGR